MTKRSPTPTSLPPRTDDIDDSWGDVDLGPPREPSDFPPSNERVSIPIPAVAVPETPAEPWARQAPFSPTIPVGRREAAAAQPANDEQPLRRPSSAPKIEIAEPSRDSLPDLELQLESAFEPEGALHWVDSQVDPNARARESAPAPPAEDEAAAADTTSSAMRDRYAVGDYTGALVIAESVLEQDPDNEDAQRYAQSCREVLTQMYAARLGPLDQTITVTIPPEQITWLSLDHRAGFLLSLVDGVSSVEEILDISGMSRLEALRILYTLSQQNVITLG